MIVPNQEMDWLKLCKTQSKLAGIYLHIPFCKQACYYCDFHFSTNHSKQQEMVQAISKEISWQKDYLHEEINTIYFGGGTPSLLKDNEIQLLLEAIYKTFKVGDQPEITLEANPDDLTKAKLNELKRAGINRLSIGIQSFHEQHLRFMNRAHNRLEALACVQDAQAIGLDNLSIDLIYGIPTEYEKKSASSGMYSHEVWQQDLSQAIALQAKHISAYCLTIEPQTVFGKWDKQQKLPTIDEEFAAQQFEILLNTLQAHDYQQYEISNFCLDGWHSKHNSNYWLSVPYIGVGPSAHSFNGKARQYNVRNNAQYVKAIAQRKIPFEQEVLTLEDRINEYLMTSLRTAWGCDLNFLKQACDFDAEKELGAEIQFQKEQGTLYLKKGVIYLTQKGKLLADQITERFFVSK